jgi:hypothetical protein
MDSQREYTTQQKAHMRPAFYATRPTRTTVFLRTFLPWQFVRFLWINLKMVIIIRRSHRAH